jgi:hypothetical protein
VTFLDFLDQKQILFWFKPCKISKFTVYNFINIAF